MLVLTLCLCVIVFYGWQRYRKLIDDAPKILPLWECVKIFLKDMDLWEKLMSLCNMAQKSEGVLRVWFYVRRLQGLYVITDPEDSMTVLKTCGEKDSPYQLWAPWLGDGSFLGSSQVSKLHRKLNTQVLKPSNMQAYMKYFNDHSVRFVQKFSDLVAQGPVDITRILRHYNLVLLFETMLGLNDVNSVNFEQYLDAVTVFMRITAMRFERILLQHDFVFEWTKHKKEQDEALEVLHRTTEQIISQRQQKLKEIQTKISEPTTDCELLIDVLIAAVENGIITEQAMKSEVNTIIFAGHDTSAFSMLYILILMGSYPHVQERAYEEIQQILGERTTVAKDDLTKMVYLEAIIKESLRVYPYAPIVYRALEEDLKLKNCTMRAGCSVAVFIWGVHRHESWGPDVEQFRPERWLEPDKLAKPTVLLGFSEGVRYCIGRRYAILSMKTLMVHLVRNFRFKADHTKMKFEYVGVLEPASGHHVAIEKRV